mmetsp:Transcript_59041/g.140705  ORF Transcript_59041/g.140705 Transcript_59041/m.140705 type:complete len:212 (-) Transcript_59041:460-1095(-)
MAEVLLSLSIRHAHWKPVQPHQAVLVPYSELGAIGLSAKSGAGAITVFVPNTPHWPGYGQPEGMLKPNLAGEVARGDFAGLDLPAQHGPVSRIAAQGRAILGKLQAEHRAGVPHELPEVRQLWSTSPIAMAHRHDLHPAVPEAYGQPLALRRKLQRGDLRGVAQNLRRLQLRELIPSHWQAVQGPQIHPQRQKALWVPRHGGHRAPRRHSC